MLGKKIDAAIAGSNLFAGNGKGIFAADEQKGQIVVPKIFVKTINGADIKQLMYLLINFRCQFLAIIIPAGKFSADICQRLQQIIRRQVAVNN